MKSGKFQLTRGQGERSRRYVYRAAYSGSFGRVSTSRFCGSVALFGAWVVCIYRVRALPEPRLGKCNDLRLFLHSRKIWRRSLWNRVKIQILPVSQGETK